MMLDNFFTLVEIKDGLTSQSRVAKLVKIMQTGSPQADKNFAEAAGQWSAVASVLAATRSTDCLYLFMKLNGLHCFNLWLQDAQRLSDKDYVSAVEESLGVLLDCLGKLPSDEEHIKSSGIAVTIKQFCDHSNTSIQSLARALLGRWNGEVVSEKVVLEKLETCDEDPSDKGPAGRTSSLTEVKNIDDAKPAEVTTFQAKDKKISGNLGIGNMKKLGIEEMSESSLLDPGEMDSCSNCSNGLITPETQHGVIVLKETKQSWSTIELEPVPEFCDHITDVLHDNGNSSDKSESTVCPSKVSVSARDRNEPIEEDAGDENLVLPNSGLKAENEYVVSLHNADEIEACVGEESLDFPTKSNKPVLDFDLNQGFDSADAVENVTTPSSPISDPSLSRDSSHITTGAQDGLGLHVQGTVGSSSFLDDHGKVSAKGCSCITKHKHDLLEFDLNVDDTVVTHQIPALSSFPSSESSIEVSSRGADRPELDLNCPADDTEPSSNVVDRKVLHCSFDELQNPSTVSSSSGQSSKINFDLNECLSVDEEYIYSQQNNDVGFANKGTSSIGASSRSNPGFVLMGSRVEIDRHKVALSLLKFPTIQNENSSLPATDFFVSKPVAFSVPPSSVFHGVPPIPFTSSSSFCGPGTVAHITGKSSALSKPSLFFVDGNHDSDAAGSSNHSSRQNFNLVMVERRKGNLKSSGPGVNQCMDGQRSTSQYPNSNGPKRKEPNDGWQTHPFNFTMQRIRR